jgi:hypothetical protein
MDPCLSKRYFLDEHGEQTGGPRQARRLDKHYLGPASWWNELLRRRLYVFRCGSWQGERYLEYLTRSYTKDCIYFA